MRKKQKYSGYYSVNEKLKKKAKKHILPLGKPGGAAKMNMVVGKKTKMGGALQKFHRSVNVTKLKIKNWKCLQEAPPPVRAIAHVE